MTSHYLQGRKKKYVLKLCLRCGKTYRGLTSGVVNPRRMVRGICPQCRQNDEQWGYSEDDLNKQEIGR